MSEHYFVIMDHRHFKVFKLDQKLEQRSPSLRLVESIDLVDDHGQYTRRESDQAGRFPGSKGNGTSGMSIDERLPMQEEYERRLVEQLALRTEAFLRDHPDCNWSFAAGANLNSALLRRLGPGFKTNLRENLQKDLGNLPVPQLLNHFKVPSAAAAPGATAFR